MATAFKRVMTRLVMARSFAACFVTACFCFFALAAFAQNTPKPNLTVAAAANLTEVAQVLGQRFESHTGIHPVFSFGSTALLTQQIENGAPFDLFLAADAEHPQELDKKGLLVKGSRTAYAEGVLALWAPAANSPINGIEDLTLPQVHVIAVAKPELAPYGAATIEALKAAGILERVQAKIVYSDNISMAKQYGSSGNADAVFTAYSLVLREKGKVIRIDEKLHRPITQELGVIAASAHRKEAARFADFILHGYGRMVLNDYGYQSPQTGH